MIHAIVGEALLIYCLSHFCVYVCVILFEYLNILIITLSHWFLAPSSPVDFLFVILPPRTRACIPVAQFIPNCSCDRAFLTPDSRLAAQRLVISHS